MNFSRAAFGLSIVLLAAMPGRLLAAAPDDNKISQLLTASRAALGGDALEHAGVIVSDAKVSSGGLTGTARAWSEIGTLRFAQEYSTPPIVGSSGYDGTSSWSGDATGLVWVDGSDLGRSQAIDSAFVTNYTLWSADHGGATIVWGGTRSADGKTYDALGVTPPNSAVPLELWFDQTTHLPARMVVAAGPTTQISTFSDYRRVSGVMYPYLQHQEDNQGNSSDVTITQAVANAPDGTAHLAKPASNVHDFSIANGAAQASIPIELVDNHVYLNVMLNGKGPYRFIFDTGGANLVDPAVAKEIGTAGAGSFQGGGVGSDTESVSFAKVSTLQIGDATVKDQLFIVVPVRAGFGATGGQKVDGLIGFEVLSRFITTFDYGANRVVLQMPGAAAPAGADVVPFVFYGQQPQFGCTISGINSQCALDTGARDSITLMGPFIAAHPQLVPANVSAVGVNGFGLGGPALGKLGRLGSLGIGSQLIPNVVADFTAQDKGAFAVPFIAANVGGGIWKRFALTLDYTKQTMALVPNANVKAPDVYERAGLFLVNKGGSYLVFDARPGTPAAQAGITKGDTIASVDGKPTSAMSLQDLRQLFYGAPGTVLQIGLVGKDGSKRTVAMTLRDFV